ncbi:zinc finger protein 62 homolog [Ischnura elegans]|uniref:zinc finger protein 62 homolog n=1 Tax=Ischnura elegans TaxID=197161 RepID=UPI001ED8A0F3|nr:zinc finger protein 62 homolog [Ischnura elegans]
MSRTTGILKSKRSSKCDLCRLCRKSNNSYYNIFTSSVACKTVKEALHDLVGLQVAVGDGLPDTMCPPCLEKLKEFGVFKNICLESNAVLRQMSPRNYCRSIEGEGAAGDKPRASVETKESIQDIIDRSARVTYSPKMTEIYIPVPDCLLPRIDELCHVKEENRDHLMEESYPMLHKPDLAGISTAVTDPLAADDVGDTVTFKCSPVKEDQISDDGERYVHNDCTDGVSSKLMHEASSDQSDPVTYKCSSVKEDEISDGEEGYVVNDCTDAASSKLIHEDSTDQPTTGEDMVPIESFNMAQKSSAEEIGVPAAEDMPIEATSNSCLPAEGSARNHSIDDCISPKALVTQNDSKTGATHVGVGRNLMDKDSEKCGALDTDEITCYSIHDDRQCNTKDIESLKRSAGGAAMTVSGERGDCDAQKTMDSLKLIRIRRNDKSGRETVKGNNEEILNCLIANTCNSNTSNENSYDCFNCRDRFSDKNELIEHMKIHVVSRNFDAVAESSVADISLKPVSSSDNGSSCIATTSRASGGRKTKRQGPRQKGNVSIRETVVEKGDVKSVRRVTRSLTADEKSSLSPKSPCARSLRDRVAVMKKGRSYSCSLCAKCFPQKNQVIVHIRSHTGERPYSCNHCELSFSTRSILVNHVRTHTGEKPYTCTFCSKAFAQKRDLTVHIGTHTGHRPFSCNQCDKSYLKKSCLVTHQRTHGGEKPYSCTICGKCFVFRGIRDSHERIHFGERPYSCDECGKSFLLKGDLVRHVGAHAGVKPFQCTLCSKSFGRRNNLDIHIRRHTGERPFSCDECGKSFVSKGHLVRHIRAHMGQKHYSCTFCRKTCARSEDLDLHMRRHTEKKPFSCEICGKSFTQRSGLVVHTRAHSGERPFSCDYCSKSFSQSSTLQGHMLTHSGKKPHACDVCGKAFARKNTLASHMRIHSRERPFSCGICKKSFKMKQALKYHMQTHTGERPFSCEICFKAFPFSFNLKTHMRIHTGEKPFICNVCGKCFARRGGLALHMRTHSEDRPYSCNECEKSFSRKRNLVSHIRTHTGEKPYSCTVCSKSFARRNGLVAHMMSNPPASQHCADRIAVRAPPFWPEEPSLWFSQLEGQFYLAGVEEDDTTFWFVLSQLDQRYAQEEPQGRQSTPPCTSYAPPQANPYAANLDAWPRISSTQREGVRVNGADGYRPPFGQQLVVGPPPRPEKSAAQTFQRLIDEVLRGLDFTYAYLDDILTASIDEDEHERHLRELFLRLSGYGVVINTSALGRSQETDEELASQTSLKLKKVHIPGCSVQLMSDASTYNVHPYFTPAFRRQAFNSIHNLAHHGVRATVKLMTSRFVWPSIKTKIAVSGSFLHPLLELDGIVERFHCQLKSAIRCHDTQQWVDVLPAIFLGSRSALKENIEATPAELVYGEPLRLPGGFLSLTMQQGSFLHPLPAIQNHTARLLTSL